MLEVAFMAEFKKSNPLPSASSLDNPSILLKLMNDENIKRGFPKVSKEKFDNLAKDDPGLLNFKYLSDESLKEAWDRLLKIQTSARPQYHVKLFLRSLYVGLPLAHRRVLDSIFENDFLGGDAFDTYEKMKNIFGQPTVETIEPTGLVCFYQNELIKETKSSMDSNFRGIFNLASTINGHVVSQNRRIDALDKKISLCVLKEIKTLCTKLDHLVYIIDNGKDNEIGVARTIKKYDNT